MLKTVGRYAAWVGMTALVVGVGLVVLRQFRFTQKATGLLPPEKSIPSWIREKLGGRAA